MGAIMASLTVRLLGPPSISRDGAELAFATRKAVALFALLAISGTRHRREELAAAMKELGVTDHRYLGGFGTYRDSGMKWHEDGHAVAADDIHENAFWHADLTEAANHLVPVIREVRPQVLVTYDQFGGYGHRKEE